MAAAPSSDKAAAKRASTRPPKERSPSPYRSREGQTTAEFVNEFWQHTINTAEQSSDDFKHQALPLARIKKVMKSDPEVKQMISSEVTVMFEKACQIFIQELAARSHMVSLSSRRRTLSRPDVAQAIAKSDMFDFLIDIVPREDPAAAAAAAAAAAGLGASGAPTASTSAAGTPAGEVGTPGSNRGRAKAPPPKRRTTGRRTRQVPEGDDDEGEADLEVEEDGGAEGEEDEGGPRKRQRTEGGEDGGEEGEQGGEGYDIPTGGYDQGLEGWSNQGF